MSEHYYSRQPQARSEKQPFTTEVKGRTFSFLADYGVFSKEGLDFGSRFLIETFVEPDISGPILDMGCGYGAVGIVLADVTRRHVVMTDVNERATSLARQNITQNEILGAQVVSGDLFSGIDNEKRFAAIVTNPPIRAGKRILYTMFSDARHYLLPGGAFWVVIRKKQGAPSAKRKLLDLYDEVKDVKKAKGYYIYRAELK